MITIETIRQLEKDVQQFDKRIDFCRHARPLLDACYEGVNLAQYGGLLRSDEADAIDLEIANVFNDAGYTVTGDEMDILWLIWDAK